MIERFDLTGQEWEFCLSKEALCEHADFNDTIRLPSTVSQQKKPPVTQERSDSYLTDPYRFEGYAAYRRTISISPRIPECDIYLVMERTRVSRLWINGTYAGCRNSLCTPHRYDITEYFTEKDMEILIVTDNVTCPIPGGHMTSPDTQTNWLGIMGGIFIECRSRKRLENVRLYSDAAAESVTVRGRLTGCSSLEAVAYVDGFPAITVTLTEDDPSFTYNMKGAVLWSEHTPVCYTMNLSYGDDTERISFGMGDYSASGRKLMRNGRRIFLRGKHDGMLFPLTGAAPMNISSWRSIFKTAKEYGINHYRFHTCCPPEAAFSAADELGIYLEPELPFWGTLEEEPDESQAYLIREGFRILNSYANHPSFFALSLGNELWGSRERLNAILGDYKQYDSRPLYTQGSNNFQFTPCIVPNDDFFVGVRFSKDRLIRGSYAMCDAPLGHIQTAAPGSVYSYDENICPSSTASDASVQSDKDRALHSIQIQYGTGVKSVTADDSGELIPGIPVISHEIGQYFMYPDYTEIPKYTGVLKPCNLEIFRDRLRDAGLIHLADRYFRASGRFAAECYRMEIEAALRSKELSGFQLLDLQDFMGQGTALVGILNSLMENKGLMSAQEWRSFCSDRVLLGCMDRFVYQGGETIRLGVRLYHYAPKAEQCVRVLIRLIDAENKDCIAKAELSAEGPFIGGVFDIGTARLALPSVPKSKKAVLSLAYGDLSNSYDIWIFPADTDFSAPANLTVTGSWEEASAGLSAGRRVLFIPDWINEALSIEETYCTDFWNYPMFSSISESMNKPLPVGTLGLLIDNTHPALAGFASEIYSTAPWYDIVASSRCLIMDGAGIEPIVRTIDNCKRNHDLADIFEAAVGTGRLLVCTFPLLKSGSFVCRFLLKRLAEYAASDRFAPSHALPPEALNKYFAPDAVNV